MNKIPLHEKTTAQSDPLQVLVDRDARAFAKFLTEQSERFSPMQKKGIVLTFGVLAAAAALALVTSPFTSSTTGKLKSSDTLAPYRRPSEHSVGAGLGSELRAIDSLYRSDPKRFAQILDQRLKMIDSLNTNR